MEELYGGEYVTGGKKRKNQGYEREKHSVGEQVFGIRMGERRYIDAIRGL